MLAILAAIVFVLCAVGFGTLGPVQLLPIGLALLALHFVWNFTPWTRTRA
jgi:hypothetical protein